MLESLWEGGSFLSRTCRTKKEIETLRLKKPVERLHNLVAATGDVFFFNFFQILHHLIILLPCRFGKIGQHAVADIFTGIAQCISQILGIDVFQELSLHRFNERFGQFTASAIQRISDDYDGDAANIWSDNPSSCAVVRRMLEFYGAGIKVAKMTANILARDFRVLFHDFL